MVTEFPLVVCVGFSGGNRVFKELSVGFYLAISCQWSVSVPHENIRKPFLMFLRGIERGQYITTLG